MVKVLIVSQTRRYSLGVALWLDVDLVQWQFQDLGVVLNFIGEGLLIVFVVLYGSKD